LSVGLSARNKAAVILTRRLLLALALVLGGCASSRATAGLDGEPHGINCSGADRTWALCAERAAEICGVRGYDVLAAGGGTAGMLETLNPSAGFDGPVNERSILIRCR
jgi:hypothetical protein